jgi:membrane protein
VKSVMRAATARVLLKDAIAGWFTDYASSMGAALSYYTLFSLAPLLLISISVAGLVFGQDAARGHIFFELRSLIGVQGAAAVQALLENANKPFQGTAATVLGVILLGIGATAVSGSCRTHWTGSGVRRCAIPGAG